MLVTLENQWVNLFKFLWAISALMELYCSFKFLRNQCLRFIINYYLAFNVHIIQCLS